MSMNRREFNAAVAVGVASAMMPIPSCEIRRSRRPRSLELSPDSLDALTFTWVEGQSVIAVDPALEMSLTAVVEVRGGRVTTWRYIES
jgi:hypothetical protein